jgi:hypothetical protein
MFPLFTLQKSKIVFAMKTSVHIGSLSKAVLALVIAAVAGLTLNNLMTPFLTLDGSQELKAKPSTDDATWALKIAGNDAAPTGKPLEALASCNDTTVIITSNFIPISPSLVMINKTIDSLKHLQGLCPTSPLIITVDGMSSGLRRKHNNTDERLAQYIQALKETYNQDHHTILASNRSIDLTNNVQNAMKQVKTEFVYVLQHDMPFVQDINHAAILKTMDEYPNVLRLVRFNDKTNKRRNVEGATTCYNETTPVDSINGINLIKTSIWSDRNHLTRKSYYEEMFQMFQEKLGRNPRFMEMFMRDAGERNCSHWGPFYYGRHGLPRTIEHLDGHRTASFARR